MPMSKAKKASELEEIKAGFEGCEMIVVTENKGLTVAQSTALRRAARAEGGLFKVTKNTLARLAIKGTPLEVAEGLFKGPVGVVSSKDPLAAARVAHKFAKDSQEKLVILGGVMSGKLLAKKEVETLAMLPSLDGLRGKIIGILQAPGAQIARVVQAYSEKA